MRHTVESSRWDGDEVILLEGRTASFEEQESGHDYLVDLLTVRDRVHEVIRDLVDRRLRVERKVRCQRVRRDPRRAVVVK